MQILQNNEYIAFLFEQSTMFQVVNTEGMPHRKDWPPTWFGDSRGRWEGDALVIEAVNFNGWAKLGTIGHPMSDQAKLTMTFKRPDFGHIQFSWVLDDPKTYTRPISNDRVFVLTPNVEVMEYSCMEGNLTSALLERVDHAMDGSAGLRMSISSTGAIVTGVPTTSTKPAEARRCHQGSALRPGGVRRHLDRGRQEDSGRSSSRRRCGWSSGT